MAATFPVFDPATGDKIGEVPDQNADDIAAAVDRAARAFPDWSGTPAWERFELLRRLYDALRANLEDLAHLMTREQGKPLAEARAEISYAADFVLWSAEEAKRIHGETIPASTRGKRIFVLRQPVGVVAAITPWNFPVAMITRKIAPALAAGCTVVVKPAEQTPMCGLEVGRLAREVGFPPGVVEIVTTSRPEVAAEVFFRHPAIRKIAFTGSTEVGRSLMRGASERILRVALELGGNAPLIVFDDADLERAVAGAIASKFRNAGQTCICANRIYVHRRIHDTFVERFVTAVRALRVGAGTEDGVEIGPLIDGAQLAKVDRLVREAVEQGARVATGGARLDRPGTFYAPTVLLDVRDEMAVAREETFGPVAPVLVFDEEEEVVRRANDTPYGLAAYFFTRDFARAHRVMEALEYGMVGVNDVRISTAQAPFGGMKQSGIGREGGRWGVEEFLEVKYVSLAL